MNVNGNSFNRSTRRICSSSLSHSSLWYLQCQLCKPKPRSSFEWSNHQFPEQIRSTKKGLSCKQKPDERRSNTPRRHNCHTSSSVGQRIASPSHAQHTPSAAGERKWSNERKLKAHFCFNPKAHLCSDSKAHQVFFLKHYNSPLFVVSFHYLITVPDRELEFELWSQSWSGTSSELQKKGLNELLLPYTIFIVMFWMEVGNFWLLRNLSRHFFNSLANSCFTTNKN